MSESWTMILAAPLDNGGVVELPTPDMPPGAQTDKAELNVGGEKLSIPDQATVEFSTDLAHATITNLTDETWQAGDTVYLYVPGFAATGEGLTSLTAQVGQNTSAISALDARVSATEESVQGLDERVSALEAAGGSTHGHNKKK
jgi:hypothetical protein